MRCILRAARYSRYLFHTTSSMALRRYRRRRILRGRSVRNNQGSNMNFQYWERDGFCADGNTTWASPLPIQRWNRFHLIAKFHLHRSRLFLVLRSIHSSCMQKPQISSLSLSRQFIHWLCAKTSISSLPHQTCTYTKLIHHPLRNLGLRTL
jgi:hypothetical protein